jgi:membrane protein DedA with SNARE-associated domain
MFDTLFKIFQDSPLSLWGPFFVLILCGLGLPVPEDVVLLTAGAVGEHEGRSWIQVSVLMYVGVMAGDSTIFLAGRHLGGRLRTARWFQRVLSEAKQARVERLFDRYHSMVLFLGRFLPGLRAPIFFTAGSMRVRYWKFFLLDGLAALVSVPFFTWLGHWLWREFQDDLTQLERTLARTHSYTMWIGIAAGAALVAVLAVWFRRVRSERE